jgi:hypothetical protein
LRNRRPEIGGAGRQILAEKWMRGLLPAESHRRIVVTFDSWDNPQTGTEVTTGADGSVAMSNIAALIAAVRIVESGHSVVVQVCAIADLAAARPTTRVWVCNRATARAIDASTLEQNPMLGGGTKQAVEGARFVTGWVVTGEPGGARRSLRRTRLRAH